MGLRVDELVAYQDRRYATRYVDDVARVPRAESRAAGPTGSPGVAAQPVKLMAYKDEYEVARLSLDAAFAAEVADQFGADATVATGCTRRCCGRWA